MCVCYITGPQGRYQNNHSPPHHRAARPSCRAAFDRIFRGCAPTGVGGSGFGGSSSHAAFGRVSFSPPPRPRHCTQSFPPQPWGQRLIPRWPTSDSAGAPDSSHGQPKPSPPECQLSDLCLQIAHLQRRPSRNAASVGNLVPDAGRWETPVPQVLHYFAAEIRASSTNPCVRMLLGKPI